MNHHRRTNRAMGIRLCLLGAITLAVGALLSFVFSFALGPRSQSVSIGAIGTGIAFLLAGLLNLVSGKNLADLQITPDGRNAGLVKRILLAFVPLFVAIAAFICIGWIALQYI